MEVKEKHKDSISEAFANPGKITHALTQGVREALVKHKQAGNPVVVWHNGKIVWLKPEEIPVHT
ncbi:MAG: hypothetical protein CV087_01120 [Candidatus Brocadia sp. WS118]|nr:MAG: hypothetical protein CV087_01120 [Candidatus Brocadia sp. WS118]